MLMRGFRAGVLRPPFPPLPTALYLLLASLLSTTLVLVLRSEAGEQQRRRRQRRRPGGLARTPQPLLELMAARLQLWAGGLTLLGQLLAMGSKSELQHWKDRAEASAILAAIMVLQIGLPSWAPRFYARQRSLIVGGARLALWLQPWVVNPRGMQAVFQAQPSQLLYDVWQLFLGTRSVAMLVTAISCPLPTLPHLVLAVFAFERCRTAAYICTACPLLRHPVWRSRIAAVHRLIDKLPLLVPEQSAACEAPLTPAAAAEAECRTFVTFFQLICGVVIPTLIVARLHAPLHDAAIEEAEGQQQQRLQQQLSRTPDSGEAGVAGAAAARRPLGGWPMRSMQAVSGRLGAIWLSAEGTLQHLCSMLLGQGPDAVSAWVLAAAVWWLLLSFSWVLALVLELPVATGMPAAATT